MVSMVKIYSEVKVIRRRHLEKATTVKRRVPCVCKDCNVAICRFEDRKYLAIGISTGGPEVLKNLFDNLSETFPLPIVVVQHITEGFLESMVAWLNTSSKAKIKVAEHGEALFPGHIYFAPNGYQMGVKQNKINLKRPDSKIRICPSVEYLFSSLLAENARHTIAMLLTGMGSDGAKELKDLRAGGALTIAQDENSSLVYGMPEKAIQLNGANYVLNPSQIIQILKDIESKFIKNK
jgi:two-component system chemotaxis response regulator CheB